MSDSEEAEYDGEEEEEGEEAYYEYEEGGYDDYEEEEEEEEEEKQGGGGEYKSGNNRKGAAAGADGAAARRHGEDGAGSGGGGGAGAGAGAGVGVGVGVGALENVGGSAAVQADVAQVNEREGLVAGWSGRHTNTVAVWIGIDPSRFLLDEERALAWGVDAARPVLIKVVTDQYYTASPLAPRVELVCQSSDMDLNVFSLQEESSCGLAWYVKNRAARAVARWPPDLQPHPFSLDEFVAEADAEDAAADEAARVTELLEACGLRPADHGAAEIALKRCKNDAGEATCLLLDENMLRELREAAAAEAVAVRAEGALGSQVMEVESGAAAATSSGITTSASTVTGEATAAATAGGSASGISYYTDAQLSELSSAFPSATHETLQEVLALSCGDVAMSKTLLADGLLPDGSLDPSVMPDGPPSLGRQTSAAEELIGWTERLRVEESGMPSYNFLFRIIHWVEDKVRACNRFCLVCDDPVPNVGLRPVVCSKELCIMSFEELGVGLDVGGEVLRDPDLFDLLITFLVAATNGGRIELMYPDSVRVDMPDGTTHQLHGNRNLLNQVCTTFPAVNMLQGWAQAGNLRPRLDALHPLTYPLLRWLISSNRSHLRKLRPAELISGLGTNHQFVLLTGPIEREAEFQRLKAETAANPTKWGGKRSNHGSFFAFHGSGLGNWHVIMRTGLKNMSNTKYMSAGAACGSGVYFADTLSVSLGYSARGTGTQWNQSRFGNMSCVALCEIIDRPSTFTHASNGIWVVQHENLIMTRFFLVAPTQNTAVASKLTIPQLSKHRPHALATTALKRQQSSTSGTIVGAIGRIMGKGKK